jgi:hypothetical protein
MCVGPAMREIVARRGHLTGLAAVSLGNVAVGLWFGPSVRPHLPSGPAIPSHRINGGVAQRSHLHARYALASAHRCSRQHRGLRCQAD